MMMMIDCVTVIRDLYMKLKLMNHAQPHFLGGHRFQILMLQETLRPHHQLPANGVKQL